MDNLDREMDKLKASIFLDSSAAFYSSLMSCLELVWDDSIPTAATDGESLIWNPEWFLSLPKEAKKTVMLHELNHVARMHMIRRENRDPKIWNKAADFRINNDLESEGYSFTGLEGALLDHSFDGDGVLSEEEIYDQMIEGAIEIPSVGCWGELEGENDEGDMKSPSSSSGDAEAQKRKILDTVIQAAQITEMNSQAGTIPGNVKKMIQEFLEPKVDWRAELINYFNEMNSDEWTWSKRNKMVNHIYLPSVESAEDGLEHLAYFVDVSGSISDHDTVRFNSEVKYIQEEISPEKLTLIQFDTEIQKVDVFEKDDPFEEVEIIGRGGTSLEPVKKWIEENEPTAAVIFSDLCCAPMDPLEVDVPILWAVIHNRYPIVNMGTCILITD